VPQPTAQPRSPTLCTKEVINMAVMQNIEITPANLIEKRSVQVEIWYRNISEFNDH
jgi:hypothetical protein